MVFAGHGPVADAEKSSSNLDRIVPPASLSPSPARVLVVDDDRDVLEELTDTLRGAGYTCLCAANGVEALDLYESGGPVDVLVTDLRMPGIDGFDLMALLEVRNPADKALQRVLVTGHATVDNAVDALRSGVTDLLRKPFGRNELLKAVASGVSRARAERQRAANERAQLARLEELNANLHRLVGKMNATSLPVGSGQPGETAMAARSERPGPRIPSTNSAINITTVRAIIKARSKRAALFEGFPVGEPSWDILLDLVLSRLSGKRVSVSSLCIASGAPMTTALRRIEDLVRQGLVQRLPDEMDGRRRYADLTNHGLELMLGYLEEVTSVAGAI